MVPTRTLTELGWSGAQVLQGDLGTAIGALVHELMQQDLVDELRLFVHPLLLGTGKRLFRELPAPRQLRLVSSGTTSLGTLVLAYRL